MSAIAQTAALTERNLARMVRNPASLVGAVVTPTVFFLGFFMVMRKILEAQGIAYEQYLPPAIVVQAMIFVGMSSAYFSVDDQSTGWAARLRSLPLPSTAVLAARLGADAVRALLSMTIVVALGLAIGFRFRAGIPATVGFVLLGVAFALAAATAFATITLAAKQPESALQALSMPYILLFMLSTAFVPAERFPDWLEPFVRNQPVSQVIDALRALSTGGPTADAVVPAVAWVGGLVIVCGAAAVRQMGRRP